MNLHLNSQLANNYKSNSQKIRILTENWVGKNLYCPHCGNEYINHFDNNKPVADFYCPHCSEEYELKSKNGTIKNKVPDGAYDTMIKRICSVNNPNFFFMEYNKVDLSVKNFMIVPKHFFVPSIIEKRKALSSNAKRAGWIGCNIFINHIPKEGKIFVIRDEKQIPTNKVIEYFNRTKFIENYKLDARGWFIDILNCINKLPDDDFNLDQMYNFIDELSILHPGNNNIDAKIRQQLQILRDKGIIEFKGRGHYKKIY